MLRAVLFVLIEVCLATAQTAPVSLSDEPHHQLLLENEHARVFSVVLPPRGSTLLHAHANDYVRVVITDGRVRFGIPGAADTTRTLNAAFTQFIPAGPHHSLTNEDAFATFRAIVVEVKKRGIRPGTVYDYSTARAMRFDSIALPVDPNATFKNSHSTPTVDGLDIQLLPTTSTSIGSCESSCLIVAVSDLKIQTTTEGAPIQLAQGQVSWLPTSSRDQVVKNVSASPGRFILLRFK